MRRKLLISTGLVVGLSLGTVATPSNGSAQTEPFVGQIMWVGFNFCPRGFAEANGQLLSINQNTALFALFGTIYGGDGETTFALPDLRGRVAIHAGQGPGLTGRSQGQKSGSENETLSTSQLPPHNHSATVNASDDGGNNASPAGALPAFAECTNYDDDGATSPVAMSSAMVSIGNTGGGAAHNNMQPYLTIRACVALVGIFPSEN